MFGSTRNNIGFKLLFILTWLYGYSQNARYKIEPQENIIKKDHYQFREFIIRRVEDE